MPALADLVGLQKVALRASQRDGVAGKRRAGLQVVLDADDAAAQADRTFASRSLGRHRRSGGGHAGFVLLQTRDVSVDALHLGVQTVVLFLLLFVQGAAFVGGFAHDGVHAVQVSLALRAECAQLFGNGFHVDLLRFRG